MSQIESIRSALYRTSRYGMKLMSFFKRQSVQFIALAITIGVIAGTALYQFGVFETVRVDAGVICPSGYTYDSTVNQCAIVQTNRNQCEAGDVYNNDGTCTVNGATQTYPASCPTTDAWVPYSSTECYLGAGDLGYIIDDAGVQGGVCLPDPVITGNTTTCVFPLNGSFSNTYYLPGNALTVEIAGAPSSTNCGLINNGSPAAAIQCADVSTTGASLGSQTLSLDTGSGLQSRGQVQISNGDITTNAEAVVNGFNPADCASYTQSTTLGSGEVCMMKLYERDGQFYSQINVPAGDDVNVRVYYNNTSETFLTNTSFADEIPANFTLNGQAQNFLVEQSADVTLPNTGVFTLAPQAGFFGQAANLSSGDNEFGKARYLNLHQCGYLENAAADGGASGDNHNDRFTFTDLGLSTFNSGTNLSSTAAMSLSCTAGDSSRPLNNILGNYRSVDLLGNRYLHLQQCVYAQNSGLPNAFQNDYSLLTTPTISTNYSAQTGADNTSARALNCGAGETGAQNRVLDNTLSSAESFDTLGQRYIHLHQCLYQENLGQSTFDQNDLSTLLDTSSVDFGSTTVINNSAAHSPTCKAGDVTTPVNPTYSGVQSLDLLDTTRGYGYLSYTMTADSGLTFDSTHGTNTTLAATEFSSLTDTKTNSIRIIDQEGIDLASWWEVSDNGTNWSSRLDNISPRQSVSVRIWFQNNLGFDVQNSYLSAALPAQITHDSTREFKVCSVDQIAETTTCSNDPTESNANLNSSLFSGNLLELSPFAGLNSNPLDHTRGLLTANALGYVQFSVSNTDQIAGTVNVDSAQAGVFGDGVAFDRPESDLTIEYISSPSLTCPYLQPQGGLREAVVSDAELRTDQDFYCNYQADICPVIFTDDNANGQVDAGEVVEDNQDVQLLDTEGNLLETIQSATDGTSCFTGLLADENYRVQVVNPLDVISTTGGSINQYFVPFGIATTTAYFGYSAGGVLTLTVPNLVDFGDFVVANKDQLVSANAGFIISDTRTTAPGWLSSCVVDQDFVDSNNLAPNLTIASRFSADSASIVEQGQQGNPAGISVGQRVTVSSFSDPFSLGTADPTFGVGIYDNITALEYLLPGFSQVGQYETQITCTAI